MPAPDDADVELMTNYVQGQVRTRISLARDWLTRTVDPHEVDMEQGALQIRLALESLMLSTLLPHRESFSAAQSALATKTPEQARKMVRNLNHGYWPKPITLASHENVTVIGEWLPVTEEYLGKQDYGRAIGITSKWLHARNPYSMGLDPEVGRIELLELLAKLVVLTNHYTVTLIDPDYILAVQLSTDREPMDQWGLGPTQVAVFRKTDDRIE